MRSAALQTSEIFKNVRQGSPVVKLVPLGGSGNLRYSNIALVDPSISTVAGVFSR